LLSVQDGFSLGQRFTGNVDRPEGPDEVGAVGNGLNITTDGTGAASGSFIDNFLSFSGQNSIIGTS